LGQKTNCVQIEDMKNMRKRYPRFKIRVMLVVIAVCCLCLAIWIGLSERQRRAVSALRSVEITQVYYDFDPEGPYPDLERVTNPAAVPAAPGWVAESVGINYFHQAVKIHIATEHIESALPHLRQLPCLREVYVFDNNDRDTRDARLDAAVNRLRRELPKVKVDVYHLRRLVWLYRTRVRMALSE